jgi:hypothetical protein
MPFLQPFFADYSNIALCDSRNGGLAILAHIDATDPEQEKGRYPFTGKSSCNFL